MGSPPVRYNIPQLLVDCKVEVWWGGDARWHPGVLHSYREHSKKYELVYEDGDTEAPPLCMERVGSVGLGPACGRRSQWAGQGGACREVAEPARPCIPLHHAPL